MAPDVKTRWLTGVIWYITTEALAFGVRMYVCVSHSLPTTRDDRFSSTNLQVAMVVEVRSRDGNFVYTGPTLKVGTKRGFSPTGRHNNRRAVRVRRAVTLTYYSMYVAYLRAATIYITLVCASLAGEREIREFVRSMTTVNLL